MIEAQLNNFFTFRSLPIFEATHFETRADSREASREAVSIFEKSGLSDIHGLAHFAGGLPCVFHPSPHPIISLYMPPHPPASS